MLQVKIKTGNAAFEGNPGQECGRILRTLAEQLEFYGTEKPVTIVLNDINGNKVGHAILN